MHPESGQPGDIRTNTPMDTPKDSLSDALRKVATGRLKGLQLLGHDPVITVLARMHGGCQTQNHTSSRRSRYGSEWFEG